MWIGLYHCIVGIRLNIMLCLITISIYNNNVINLIANI